MALLPTFSPSGWVSNPIEKADYMLAHFFTTQKSQTHYHKANSNVMSYQSLIADASSSGDLATNLDAYLGIYFKSQFDNVQMNCQVYGAFGDPNNTKLTIQIGCSFDANGIRYSIARAIELLGQQVQRVYNVDATGSP